jgi:hypothetical protein
MRDERDGDPHVHRRLVAANDHLFQRVFPSAANPSATKFVTQTKNLRPIAEQPGIPNCALPHRVDTGCYMTNAY